MLLHTKFFVSIVMHIEYRCAYEHMYAYTYVSCLLLNLYLLAVERTKQNLNIVLICSALSLFYFCSSAKWFTFAIVSTERWTVSGFFGVNLSIWLECFAVFCIYFKQLCKTENIYVLQNYIYYIRSLQVVECSKVKKKTVYLVSRLVMCVCNVWKRT